MSGFAELEGKFDVMDISYDQYAWGREIEQISSQVVVSNLSAVALTVLDPVAGVLSSSSVHCALLTGKHMRKNEVAEEQQTQKRFELFSACLVRMPLAPFISANDAITTTFESGSWNESTDATIGSIQGLDGYADVLAYIQIQQEAIAQLEQAAEGSEELALAKVMIDGYLLDKNAPDMKRSEAAEKILSEITLDV